MNLIRKGTLEKAAMLVTEFVQDCYYYCRHSGVSPLQNMNKRLFYKIIIETHAIEKGLSLSDPRRMFGRQKIQFVINALKIYDRTFSDFPVQMASGALEAYASAHRKMGLSDPLLDEIEGFLASSALDAVARDGGLRLFPDGLPSVTDGDVSHLITSRFSSRMFDASLLDHGIVTKIVRIAQAAPSQCNRQATKLYFFQDRHTIDTLLKLQGGATGFSHHVHNLAVVAFDLAAWGGAQQRNQGYVDASLFAMSLMLAAHALGIISCPLNLAVPHSVERSIRRVGHIPKDERLVMMIALGYPAASPLKAARSARRQTAEILIFDDGYRGFGGATG